VYVVTALEMIKSSVPGLQALILAPTREIAVQGVSVAMQVGSDLPNLKMASFIGGVSLAEDKIKCKSCHLAVGTPGRVKQLITEGFLKTEGVRLVALDEADKLLEPAFLGDTTEILNLLPRSKQVLALSATYPPQLAKLAERFMRSPKHIRPGQSSQVLTGVSQFMIKVDHCPVQTKQISIKHAALLNLLSTVPYNQVLVFSNYSTLAQSTSDFLNSRGFPSICMSAVQDQSRRLLAINSFKNFSCRILCSTDLTARGIDAENVNLVVNLEVPWDHNTYLHRIGRGGRYGSLSNAVTLVSKGAEEGKLKVIVNKTGSIIRILPEEIPSDLKHNIDEFVVLDNVEEVIETKKPFDTNRAANICDATKGSDPNDVSEMMENLLLKSTSTTGYTNTENDHEFGTIDEIAARLNSEDFIPYSGGSLKPDLIECEGINRVLKDKASERRKGFQSKLDNYKAKFNGMDVTAIVEYVQNEHHSSLVDTSIPEVAMKSSVSEAEESLIEGSNSDTSKYFEDSEEESSSDEFGDELEVEGTSTNLEWYNQWCQNVANKRLELQNYYYWYYSQTQ